MIKPGPDRATVTIRCLWTDEDRVEQVMTEASVAVRVAATQRCGGADQLANREGVHHLLVTEGDEVVGVVCRCALSRPDQLIEDCMDRVIWTVPASATLGQAAEALEQHGTSVLVVADQATVLGVVTRCDLGLDEHGVRFATDGCACHAGSSSR